MLNGIVNLEDPVVFGRVAEKGWPRKVIAISGLKLNAGVAKEVVRRECKRNRDLN